MAKPRPDIGGGNVVKPRVVTKTRDTFRPSGPKGVFAQPLTQKPFTKQRAQQRSTTRRAVRNLAPQPKPYIPVKKTYTAPERKAIVEIVHRNANRVASTIKDSGDETLRFDQRALGFQREAARSGALLSQLRALPPAAQRAYLTHIDQKVSPGVRRRMEALIRSTGGKPVLGPPTPTQTAQMGDATKGIIRSRTAHKLAPRSGGVPRWAMALVSPNTNLAVALAKGVSQKGSPYRNAARNLKDLAIFPVTGGYALGKALLPLASLTNRGEARYGELEKFAGGIADSFIHGAVGELAQGHVKEAEAAFAKDPVFSALDLAGLGSIAGRSAGALARAGGKVGASSFRDRLARVGSTTRSPLDFGSPSYHEREYSRDLIRKGFQVLADKRRAPATNQAGKPIAVRGPGGRRVPVLRAEGVTPGSRLRHPLVGSEAEQLAARRATFVASRENAVERLTRDQAVNDLVRIGKLPTPTRRALEEVLGSATTGTIRSAATAIEDLTKRRNTLADRVKRFDEGDTSLFSHKAERDATARQVKAITKVLDSPKARENIGRLVEAGFENARRLNERDARAIDLKLVNKRSAIRTRMFHWAQEHMGAKYHTPEEHKALEREARVSEQQHLAVARELHGGRNVHYLGDDLPSHKAREVFDALKPDDEIWVFHATDRAETAEAFAAKGVDPASKPRRLAAERHAAGEQAEFSPGNGAGAGIYVGRRPADVAGLGRHVVAMRVKVRDIVEPPEQAGAGAGGALSVGDAMIAGKVPANRVKVLKTDPKIDTGVQTPALLDQILSTPEKLAEAQAAHAAARDHRIAISGRDPRKVRAHEAARTAHARAAKAVKKAENDLRKAWNARARLVGAQASRRGRRQADALGQDISKVSGERAAGRATKGEKAKLDKATANVKAAQAALREARKRRQEARGALDKNPMPAARAGLRTAEGKILTDREIIADIERHRGPGGFNTIAYLPDRMDVRGARAYHTQFRMSRPNLNRESRTGSAYEKGINDVSIQAVADEFAHKATQVAKAEQIDKALRENAWRHPAAAKAARGEPLTKSEQRVVDRGGHFTAKEAEQLREKLEADSGERYTLVRAFNSKSMSGESAAAMQGTKGMELFSGKLLNERLNIDMGSSARNVMLVPTKFVEELNRNLTPADAFRRFLQMVNKPFRFAVLAQPRWLTGNFVEPYLIRLPMIGSGPINLPGMAMDVRASLKLMRALKNSKNPADQALYAELKAHHQGGLFIGDRGLSNRRTAEEIAGIGHYWGFIKRLPIVHQFGWLIKHTLGAYFPINRGIESLAQHAAFGNKLRREVQEFTGSYFEGIRMGEKAIAELKNRMINTPTQQRFAKFQDDLLGQYSRFPAWLREQIQGWAPFLPWFMASARFVFWTMPTHHPAKTAFLQHASETIQEEWDKAHEPGKIPPGGLRLALPRKDGGFTDVARYTPYGFPGPVASGDTSMLVDPFFPQFQGAVKALEGKDPFGRDLQVPKGEKVNVPSILVNTILESIVPGLAQGRRLREHGETAYSNSTIVHPKTKPGTSHGMSALERTYSPLRPTYLRTKGSGGSLENVSPAERRALEAEARRALESGAGVSATEQKALEAEARRLLAGGR